MDSVKTIVSYIFLAFYIVLSVLIGDEVFSNELLGAIVFGIPAVVGAALFGKWGESADFQMRSAGYLLCSGVLAMVIGFEILGYHGQVTMAFIALGCNIAAFAGMAFDYSTMAKSTIASNHQAQANQPPHFEQWTNPRPESDPTKAETIEGEYEEIGSESYS